MYGSMGAGMLRGWIMLWSTQLTWLLAATALSVGVAAVAEGVAIVRRKWHAPTPRT